MKKCENCNLEHEGTYGSGRFCSLKCARGFSTKDKRKEINEKVSKTLTGRELLEETKKKLSDIQKSKSSSFKGKKHSEKTKRKIAKTLKEHTLEKEKNATSILELSKRTVTKVLERMNKGCSRCGWNESTCDIHHINGRKIKDADHHNNLCLLCPNCHRLVHTHKVKKDELINLIDYIGDEWKNHYYW